MYYEDLHADWVTIEEAAQRLNVTTAYVKQLVEEHVLRAKFDGGIWLVQPAIVKGYTA